MFYWQPVERPEKWSGVSSTSLLADNSECYFALAVYVERRSWCTVEAVKHGVAVVQYETEATIMHTTSYLSQVVG